LAVALLHGRGNLAIWKILSPLSIWKI
jgi:hypothetical protein